MLEWLLKTHADTAKRLKAVQVEACRLEGGLAALEAAIQQARKAGGGSVAAPVPAPKASAPTPGMESMKAVKIGHGPVQATEELRE